MKEEDGFTIDRTEKIMLNIIGEPGEQNHYCNSIKSGGNYIPIILRVHNNEAGMCS